MSGVFFVTAMAAVSGTAVVLFALKLHKSIPPMPSPIAQLQSHSPRPCISSGEKKVEKERKKKKRVTFAKDVVEPTGNNEEFRRRLHGQSHRKSVTAAVSVSVRGVKMPANRAALYNGILRDRVMHRIGCSY